MNAYPQGAYSRYPYKHRYPKCTECLEEFYVSAGECSWRGYHGYPLPTQCEDCREAEQENAE